MRALFNLFYVSLGERALNTYVSEVIHFVQNGGTVTKQFISDCMCFLGRHLAEIMSLE